MKNLSKLILSEFIIFVSLMITFPLINSLGYFRTSGFAHFLVYPVSIAIGYAISFFIIRLLIFKDFQNLLLVFSISFIVTLLAIFSVSYLIYSDIVVRNWFISDWVPTIIEVTMLVFIGNLFLYSIIFRYKFWACLLFVVFTMYLFLLFLFPRYFGYNPVDETIFAGLIYWVYILLSALIGYGLAWLAEG